MKPITEIMANPEELSVELLAILERARGIAGIPFVITSGYRPGDPGSHGMGFAVDIAAGDSRTRYKIVHALMVAGAYRVGVYGTHLHVDVDPERDEDVLWVEVSTTSVKELIWPDDAG